MGKVKKQHRSTTKLIVIAIIACVLFLLWNVAMIRPDSQPSVLPGPIWLLRFEPVQKYTGLNEVVYKVFAVLVTAGLVGGMCSVAYFRKPTWLGISLACLVFWFLIGVAMQQTIAVLLPLEPIEDQPNLPRVLLIGDSISIGYTLNVRQLLSGQANVHRANTNCGSTIKGLRLIDNWLSDGDWDVIHFNWGLHDLRYAKTNVTPPLDPEVSLDAYEQNLNVLVQRLKQTGANLIWATTTPVLHSCDGTEPDNVPRYNRVAARVMEQHDIPINNLFDFAKSRLPEIQPRNDIHFTFDGYCQLAEQVAGAINQALSEIQQTSNDNLN